MQHTGNRELQASVVLNLHVGDADAVMWHRCTAAAADPTVPQA